MMAVIGSVVVDDGSVVVDDGCDRQCCGSCVIGSVVVDDGRDRQCCVGWL